MQTPEERRTFAETQKPEETQTPAEMQKPEEMQKPGETRTQEMGWKVRWVPLLEISQDLTYY